MLVLASGRRTSRTTKLAERCIEDDGILIVPTEDEMRRLKSIYSNLNVITIGRIHNDNMMQLNGIHNKPIYIDNVDKILRNTFSGLSGYSITVPEEI